MPAPGFEGMLQACIVRGIFLEAVMKSVARTILFGGIIVATQAAVGDTPALSDAAGAADVSASSTYAEPQTGNLVTSDGSAVPAEVAGDRPAVSITYAVTSAASAFPTEAQDMGPSMVYQSTYADLHANDPVRSAGLAFPAEARDMGPHMAYQSTYADSRIDRPVLASSQLGQRADTSAN
jgi:hypothetical protein